LTLTGIDIIIMEMETTTTATANQGDTPMTIQVRFDSLAIHTGFMAINGPREVQYIKVGGRHATPVGGVGVAAFMGGEMVTPEAPGVVGSATSPVNLAKALVSQTGTETCSACLHTIVAGLPMTQSGSGDYYHMTADDCGAAR